MSSLLRSNLYESLRLSKPCDPNQTRNVWTVIGGGNVAMDALEPLSA